MAQLTVGSLFSGIGGIDLGLERAGMVTRWQVENNPYCQRVLTKHWPMVRRYADVKTIKWTEVEPVDLVCGGFPCQPFSVAGKQRGQADDRYLWPEVVRCLDTLRPTWFLGENVPGLIKMALDQVCTDLESLGYTVWPVCVPACAVDAPHQRQRVWILAHSRRKGCARGGVRGGEAEAGEIQDTWFANGGQTVADAERDTLRIQPRGSESRRADTDEPRYDGEKRPALNTHSKPARWSTESWRQRREWLTEPAVGRVAHGVPHRVDRLKGLGNAVVPQVVEELGRFIQCCVENGAWEN